MDPAPLLILFPLHIQAILSNSPLRWSKSLKHRRSSAPWASEHNIFHFLIVAPNRSKTHRILRHLRPWKTKSFRKRHKLHKAAVADIFKASHCFRFLQKEDNTVKESGTLILKHSANSSQTCLATMQSKNRCWIVSNSSQKTQVLSSTCLRLAKLSLVRLLFNAFKKQMLDSF